MSLSGYDLRKRGGPRHAWRLRPRWRRLTAGEVTLAGWIVYALVVAACFWAVDHRGVQKFLSVADSPPARTTKIDAKYSQTIPGRR